MGNEAGGIVRGIGLALAVVAVACAPVQKSGQKDLQKSVQIGSVTAATLPLVFEPNRGQTDKRVHYLARNPAYTLFLTAEGAVLTGLVADAGGHARLGAAMQRGEVSPFRRVTVTMKLDGVTADAKPAAEDRRPGKVNYYIGRDPKGWPTGIPVFGRVRYRDVYPGIDMVYRADGGRLSYEFIVHPGARASAIGLTFPGARGLAIDAKGDLIVTADGATVRHTAPVLYQVRDGKRLAVDGRFVVKGERVAGFKVGRHDPELALVIDPAMADFVSYFGGTLGEFGGDAVDSPAGSGIPATPVGPNFDIAVDAGHRLFVAGTTVSSDLPVTDGSQPSNSSDMFAMRVDFSGPTPELFYATYISGNSLDFGNAIAPVGDGAAYVAGSTISDDLRVSDDLLDPAPPPYQTDLYLTTDTFGWDSYIARLNGDGELVRATYLGQQDLEMAWAIDVDPVGGPGVTPAVYVTGTTLIDNGQTNLATANAVAAQPLGLTDGFVARLDLDLSNLTYFTYLGGVSYDYLRDIAVRDGSIFVAGNTFSTDLATTNDAAQPNPGIPQAFVVGCTPQYTSGWAPPSACGDGFVVRIDPGANPPLRYLTYLGGSNFDAAMALALGPGGEIHVAGTADTGLPDPGFEILVAKIDSAGQEAYRRHYGGAANEAARDITVVATGDAFVTGWTLSPGLAMPNAMQNQLAPSPPGIDTVRPDAFVGIYDPDGLLRYFTYFGGDGNDFGLSIDVEGNFVHVGGVTNSSNLIEVDPLPNARGELRDVFLLRFGGESEGVAPTIVKSVAPANIALGDAVDYWINLENPGNLVIGGVTLSDQLPPGLQLSNVAVSTTNGANCAYAAGAVDCTFAGFSPAFQPGLVPGATTVHVTGTVSGVSLVGAQGELCNTAELSGGALAQPLSAQDCHANAGVPSELAPNLTLSKEDTTDPVPAGQDVVYELIVLNSASAPASAINVSVTDVLPPGVTLQSVAVDGTPQSLAADADACGVIVAAPSTETLECALGDLPPGQGRLIEITATPAPVPGEHCNSARVNADNLAPEVVIERQECTTVTIRAGCSVLTGLPVGPLDGDLQVGEVVYRPLNSDGLWRTTDFHPPGAPDGESELAVSSGLEVELPFPSEQMRLRYIKGNPQDMTVTGLGPDGAVVDFSTTSGEYWSPNYRYMSWPPTKRLHITGGQNEIFLLEVCYAEFLPPAAIDAFFYTYR